MIEPVLGTRCLHRHVTTIVGIDRRVKLTDEAANSANVTATSVSGRFEPGSVLM
jgi:hypothetical protein